ncbi:HD domain-containing phosphohydrolase [Pseudoalteromonas denitrificans]|uniref:HD domain-containing protein n=1 Tax=Pseudoalteromonas denitrificans DSM 6059 TaxID=1123010 RepID=A0A1I1GSU2_9GAMM|nr:HD domain-containing phosphohydrolase [Pseudoalteromonas denitrificans]SFC12293.1 HD domain-containing protein [Pseudoalteromonas denitrificans DSM 6059]
MFKNSIRRFRISIHLTLVSIFFIATSLTAVIAIGLHYYFSMSFATETALNSFQITAKYTRDYLSNIDEQATKVTKVLAQNTSLLNSNALTSANYHLFAQVMENNPIFYSLYIGQGNGKFNQLINLDASPLIRKQFSASPTDRWLNVKSNARTAQQSIEYLDKNFNMRHIRETQSDFDPTKRLWYQKSRIGKIYKSDPYQFNSLQAPGLTFSTRLADSGNVLGIDIALSSLSSHLQEHQLPQGSEIYLYQESGELIATSNTKHSQLKVPDALPLALTVQQELAISNIPAITLSNSKDWVPIDFAISGQPKGYAIDVFNLVSQMTGIRFEYVNGFSWPKLVSMFKNKELDALQAVYDTPENRKIGALSDTFLNLPFAVVTQVDSPEISSIQSLNNKTLAIAEGWSITQILKGNFPLINIIEFKTPKEAILAVKTGEADAALDSKIILENMISQYFIEDLTLQPTISFSPIEIPENLHLLLHHEHADLLPTINMALRKITQKQKNILQKKWLETQFNSALNQSINVPYKPLISYAKKTTTHNKLIKQMLPSGEYFMFISPVNMSNQNKSYFAVVAPYATIIAPSLAKVKISILITVLCLLCMLPISYLFAGLIENPIRRLVEQNNLIKHRKFNEIETPFTHIKEFDELADSLTDMASSIQKHENNQKQLMESFIELIAQAIDDKSPYTAGHCERVPELGIMLVNEASRCETGCFSDFALKTEDQQREFRIAAWLHDCGKITTPDHIVDKGTKLETIYNRIHEIRMRFEVLWRDAEIDYYKKILLEPDSGAFYKQELKHIHNQLQDDFAFVAQSNIGGEFMGNDKIERLTQISKQTWLRYFDDGLGLSPIEFEKHSNNCKIKLPVTEKLLMDKKSHIEKRTRNKSYDPSFGIKMTIPEKLYNRGELYNLSISRGTLTAEDRYKINEHVISTIKMLDNLPFPPELKNVPRYASTHHETLIGTGYPRKLSAKDLSIPEKILVLADIFEALTAADRPYKKAKPLSVAIDIIYKMVLDKHIDRDIFVLFLTSGVYLSYAQKYLPPSQLDTVDINKYLNIENVA